MEAGWSGPGFYLHWAKILTCWLVFLFWVWTTDWLSTDAQTIDANFEDKIRLVGWRVTPPEVEPGTSVEIELFSECLTAMKRDWRLARAWLHRELSA